MAAADLAPPDLTICIDGYAETCRRLIQNFGFTIRYGSLGPDIGEYDGDLRLITVNCVAPLEDQLWFLLQAWQVCVLGIQAVTAAVPEERTLRLVGD